MTLRDRIAEIDGVRDVAMARGYPMNVGTKYDFSVASSPDGSYFSRIDAPVVLSGRLPHVSSVDEVAISESVARELGLGPGDALQGTVFDPATVAAFISTVDLAPANVSERSALVADRRRRGTRTSFKAGRTVRRQSRSRHLPSTRPTDPMGSR